MSIQITDVVAATVTIVAAVLLEPFYVDMINDWTAVSGTLTSVLASLFLPLVFLGVILSIGVSARRGS